MGHYEKRETHEKCEPVGMDAKTAGRRDKPRRDRGTEEERETPSPLCLGIYLKGHKAHREKGLGSKASHWTRVCQVTTQPGQTRRHFILFVVFESCCGHSLRSVLVCFLSV